MAVQALLEEHETPVRASFLVRAAWIDHPEPSQCTISGPPRRRLDDE
jgi:hypothetical protein